LYPTLEKTKKKKKSAFSSHEPFNLTNPYLWLSHKQEVERDQVGFT